MPLQKRVLPTQEIVATTGRGLLMGNRGVGELPDGAMIRYGGGPGLVLGGRVLGWRWQGYAAPVAVPPGAEVDVLTPAANLAVLAAGYRPLLHPTADRN